MVLRSRLKVRVVKELRGKKVAVHNGLSENGVPAPSLDTETGKQTMQYQVCGLGCGIVAVVTLAGRELVSGLWTRPWQTRLPHAPPGPE